MTTTADDGQQDRITTTAALRKVPSWQRWSIRKLPTPGNVWHVEHDCGYYALVDLGANNHAIVEAEHAHERSCR